MDEADSYEDSAEDFPQANSSRVSRVITFTLIAVYFCFCGVEYAIVIPVLWEYLQGFGGNQAFLGMVMSSYNLSALIINPIMGWMSDGRVRTKTLLLICMVFQLSGSCLYFTAPSKEFVLLSQLVAGLGTGAGASIMGDISKATPKEEKTKLFALFMMFRQLGIVIGPGFNLGLRSLSFYIGSVYVGPLNAPGFFMACVWTCLWPCTVILYHDLVSTTSEPDITPRSSLEGSLTTTPESVNVTPQMPPRYGSVGFTVGTSVQNTPTSPYAHQAAYGTDETSQLLPAEPHSRVSEYCRVFFREEVIVILIQVLFSAFDQSALETTVTPMTQTYLSWDELGNSLLFCGCGVYIVCIFLLVRFLSSCFHDWTLCFVGCVLIFFSMPVGAVVGFHNVPSDHLFNAVVFFGAVFLNMSGIPLMVVCSLSLFTKMIPARHQGFAQGLRRSVMFVGMILGPLWAGVMEPHVAANFLALGGVYVVLCAILLFSRSWIIYCTALDIDADDCKSPVAVNGEVRA